MKVRTYIRVGKDPKSIGKPKVDARASKGFLAPFTNTAGNAIPTVAFAVDLVIPDEAFKSAERAIAEITIPDDALEIAAEVRELV